MLINEVNTADLFQALTQHVMVVFGDEFRNMYHLRINMFQIITKGGSWCTIMVKPYKHYFCYLYNLLFVIWDNDLNGLERKWLDFLITWRRFTSYLRSVFSSKTNLISCLTKRSLSAEASVETIVRPCLTLLSDPLRSPDARAKWRMRRLGRERRTA